MSSLRGGCTSSDGRQLKQRLRINKSAARVSPHSVVKCLVSPQLLFISRWFGCCSMLVQVFPIEHELRNDFFYSVDEWICLTFYGETHISIIAPFWRLFQNYRKSSEMYPRVDWLSLLVWNSGRSTYADPKSTLQHVAAFASFSVNRFPQRLLIQHVGFRFFLAKLQPRKVKSTRPLVTNNLNIVTSVAHSHKKKKKAVLNGGPRSLRYSGCFILVIPTLAEETEPHFSMC